MSRRMERDHCPTCRTELKFLEMDCPRCGREIESAPYQRLLIAFALIILIAFAAALFLGPSVLEMPSS